MRYLDGVMDLFSLYNHHIKTPTECDPVDGSMQL